MRFQECKGVYPISANYTRFLAMVRYVQTRDRTSWGIL
jgi:hypothetical protein